MKLILCICMCILRSMKLISSVYRGWIKIISERNKCRNWLFASRLIFIVAVNWYRFFKWVWSEIRNGLCIFIDFKVILTLISLTFLERILNISCSSNRNYFLSLLYQQGNILVSGMKIFWLLMEFWFFL